MMNNLIVWFKSHILPQIIGYQITETSYQQGDFGDLYRIEFESEIFGGNIDFWSEGWLEVFVVDYERGECLRNSMLSPKEAESRQGLLENLVQLLVENG